MWRVVPCYTAVVSPLACLLTAAKTSSAARLQVGTLAWLQDGSQEQPDCDKPRSKAAPLHHRYGATGAVNKTC